MSLFRSTRSWHNGILGSLLGVAMMCPLLYAGDFSHYRGLQFGMDLAAAAKEAGTQSVDAKLVHKRPALIQEMEWQPRPPVVTGPASADPVKSGLLSFVNGELFRIIVTYDRYKVEGMTADDMIEGISATYGQATRPAVEIAFHSNYAETAKVLARWEDPQYSYNLVKTGDQSSFAMVLYSKRLEALAQAAIADAVRLDAQEAPQRELDKQKDQEEADSLVREKARSVNKPNFRP
jgi:hypothetical protein